MGADQCRAKKQVGSEVEDIEAVARGIIDAEHSGPFFRYSRAAFDLAAHAADAGGLKIVL